MLNSAKVSKLLIESEEPLLERFAAEIERNYQVRIVRAAEKSLVMSQARDTVSHQPFYLGEILVTECTVELNGVYGYGILMGERSEEAYRLAVVDAAFRSHAEETAGWEGPLREAELRLEERRRSERRMIDRTKVHFDTMGEYHERNR
ncbi:phosphonate C-P lyase system protein PhnG [Cohnella zeiphila]|uniref:Phosphonate C-P lyase system protein PhnG n=1 Tax=Cohnella zeiphila TaxID=2761120 RepID=A0A7X0W0I6_9BACL|nr:phosphonate C-P lyase system protein PhnG [Cohnella zeiphila]MBB6735098.1 phosphonate C-P lyase system protein PhnG [Cohnella zeiphila]